MALDENLCDIFRNNDISARDEFSLSELNKDDVTLLDAIFPHKEESLLDLFKTRPFTGEIEYLNAKRTIEKLDLFDKSRKNKLHSQFTFIE